MTVPELFDRDHALSASKLIEKHLRGSLGMRTLDPIDYEYRPYYYANEYSGDFNVAKGRNYHQGPEWVWLAGDLLRASL